MIDLYRKKAVPSARPRPASGHVGRLGRGNHDGRAPCTGRIVDGDRVVGRIRGDSRDVVANGLNRLDARRRVIDRRVGERISDDRAGLIDTHMEFLPPARATAPVFRSSPFTLADNRQTRAVDDEMKACARWNVPKLRSMYWPRRDSVV
jgi:hypothetical protein